MSDHEDLYRWCIYCKADCSVDRELQEHADDCPTVTGVYTVTERDLDPCPHCGESNCPIVCAQCETNLALGDHYMLLDQHGEVVVQPDDGDYGEIVCVGCAATRELTS